MQIRFMRIFIWITLTGTLLCLSACLTEKKADGQGTAHPTESNAPEWFLRLKSEIKTVTAGYEGAESPQDKHLSFVSMISALETYAHHTRKPFHFSPTEFDRKVTEEQVIDLFGCPGRIETEFDAVELRQIVDEGNGDVRYLIYDAGEFGPFESKWLAVFVVIGGHLQHIYFFDMRG